MSNLAVGQNYSQPQEPSKFKRIVNAEIDNSDTIFRDIGIGATIGAPLGVLAVGLSSGGIGAIPGAGVGALVGGSVFGLGTMVEIAEKA